MPRKAASPYEVTCICRQLSLSYLRQLLSDENYAMEGLPSPLSIKVHAKLCSELLNLVGLVSTIIPEIEDARPRDLGMEALCLLHDGVTKAKSLLQRCGERSVLYLVLTGEDFLSRCIRSRNLLDYCLGQIQNKVSLMLATKISGIILAIRRASFCLSPSEEKARELLFDLLHRYGSTIDSTEDFALSAIHSVCSLLHISSPGALVIEKRSIRRQLDRVGETRQDKKKFLRLFLRLIERYRKHVTEDRKHNGSMEPQENSSFSSLDRAINDLNLSSDFRTSTLSSQSSHCSCTTSTASTLPEQKLGKTVPDYSQERL